MGVLLDRNRISSPGITRKRNLAVLYLLGDLTRIKRRMIFEIACQSILMIAESLRIFEFLRTTSQEPSRGSLMLNSRIVLHYQRHWRWALTSCLSKKQWQEVGGVMEVVEEEAEAVAEVLGMEAVDSLEDEA